MASASGVLEENVAALLQGRLTDKMMAEVSTKEVEVKDAILAIDAQIAGMNTKLSRFVLTKQDQGETDEEGAVVIGQAAVEQTALNQSHKLPEELLSSTPVTVPNAHGVGVIQIQYGNHNKGVQAGINHGTIHNTFNGPG
ncbi:hypothetical protein GQ53DRAFT_833889 [Thozetella sp. PMI_491]|nr:hypothetical protein GQ53DRAFT_833889 [Thozetella sp. PMI_491]